MGALTQLHSLHIFNSQQTLLWPEENQKKKQMKQEGEGAGEGEERERKRGKGL